MGTTVLDSFLLTDYRSGKYTISIKDVSASANAYQISDLVLIHAGDISHSSEYAIITTNGVICSFSTTVNATSCILNATTLVSNVQVKWIRTLVGT